MPESAKEELYRVYKPTGNPQRVGALAELEGKMKMNASSSFTKWVEENPTKKLKSIFITRDEQLLPFSLEKGIIQERRIRFKLALMGKSGSISHPWN